MDINPSSILTVTVPFVPPTLEQLRSELRELSGLDYLPEVPTLREWMTPEQLAEMTKESQSLTEGTVRTMLHMAVQAARAAYEKGRQDERDAHDPVEE